MGETFIDNVMASFGSSNCKIVKKDLLLGSMRPNYICYHVHISSCYTPEAMDKVCEIARKNGFVKIGGGPEHMIFYRKGVCSVKFFFGLLSTI